MPPTWDVRIGEVHGLAPLVAVASVLVALSIVVAFVRLASRRRQLARVLEARKALGLDDAPLSASDGHPAIALARVTDRDASSEGGYRDGTVLRLAFVPRDARTWSRVTATMPSNVPWVRVVPRRGLGSVHAVLTGDAAFDEVFETVAASPGDAARLVDWDVRRAMLQLPRSHESPRFLVDASTVAIEWKGDPERDAVARASHAVRALVERLAPAA
jgi:hypothetical protein